MRAIQSNCSINLHTFGNNDVEVLQRCFLRRKYNSYFLYLLEYQFPQYQTTTIENTIMTISFDSWMSQENKQSQKSNQKDSTVTKWKKKTPPILDTWMHTNAAISEFWRHGWFKVVNFTSRGGEVIQDVWGDSWNCWEPPQVLQNSNRFDGRGRLQIPPKICPMCLMTEWVREQVIIGKMKMCDPVFEFRAGDVSNVLVAAGIYNGFSGDLTSQEKQEMRRANIYQKEAWKQNLRPKKTYAFIVVDNDAPELGAQIAIETQALGDAIKKTIRHAMTKMGDSEGHPLKNPYCIRWSYHPENPKFQDKYDSIDMPRIKLTEAVRAHIMDEPAPDIEEVIRPGDLNKLRMLMEGSACIEMPFDYFFEAAEKKSYGASDNSSLVAPRESAAVAAPEVQKAPIRRIMKKPQIPCENCHKMMDADATECPHCHVRYELDNEDDVPF